MIRIASEDNLEEIFAMSCDALAEKGEGFDGDHLRSSLSYSISIGKICVAMGRSGITGFLVWSEHTHTLTGLPILRKVALYVSPKHRGSSAALKLMLFAIERAKMIGANKLIFSAIIDSDCKRVSSLYQKLGLHPTEITHEMRF